ncbi:MAG: hypothetical protein II797_01815 [Clostridia bacterium]|nr:hypothetical protein [Clostridia bacterium]
MIRTYDSREVVSSLSEKELSLRLSVPSLSALPVDMGSLLDGAKEELARVIRPTVSVRSTLCRTGGGLVWFPFGEIRSQTLNKALSGCGKAVFFCATLGLSADRYLRSGACVSTLYAFVSDAVASAAVEALCDLAMMEETENHTPRVSPGYGDFGLENQKTILDFLRAEKEQGIHLTSENLMIPTKTVTAVYGIRDK